MKQSLNRLLYKFGSKRGFISAIVSAVGVIISGLWFRHGIQLLHTEAIPIIIFIGFILGGILLELVIFRLISNGMLVLSTEVINANTSSDAEIAENDNIPLDALPSDSDENAESDNDTISDNEN